MDATPVGALLLCRAGPAAVRLPARLLRAPMALAPAGQEWSVLVPENGPWLEDGEPVDAVLGGWASALSIGTGRPVLALWWDGDGAGFTMASGFRRPVGFVWFADGTPVGEDEAMRTFAARLRLDPVLDVQALEQLTADDPASDATARLVGLAAVLTRHGLALPAGLAPGAPADALRAAAHAAAVEESAPAGRPEPPAGQHAARLWSAGAVQLAAGLALVALGARRRSAGWAAAGAVLIVYSLVPQVRERLRS